MRFEEKDEGKCKKQGQKEGLEVEKLMNWRVCFRPHFAEIWCLEELKIAWELDLEMGIKGF